MKAPNWWIVSADLSPAWPPYLRGGRNSADAGAVKMCKSAALAHGNRLNFAPMNTFLRLAFFLTCWLSSTAFAQWQWLDKDGRPVFSDRAPPPSVAEKSIVRRPAQSVVAPVANAADGAVAPASAAASATQASGVDKNLAEQKKKADAADAAKRKTEEDRIAAARADNCKRARAAQVGLNSGVRMSRMTAQGEREVMDDAARAVEAKRIQSIITSDCK